MIRAIMACDSQGGIAKNGVMPWPKNMIDLKHFKMLTAGNTVVMGRHTWEASDMLSPLPGRQNIVITSNTAYDAEGAETLSSNIISNLTILAESNIIFVIGGAKLFKLLIDEIQILYLSRIVGSYECDTFLPMNYISKCFEQIDSVDVDKMTIFETYIARKYNDISIRTKL
jgi:dihydrofolate reductase